MTHPFGSALDDRYTIERELGGGGMSRVFVAMERALGRRVVIKTLPDGALSADGAERFRREILVAAQLQHANIVPVLAASEANGVPYFVMPFVDGTTLRQRLGGGAMSVRDAVSVLRDMARALQAAHSKGVVHRDIKPENVLLSEGAALVTDFGVAKAISLATGSANTSDFGMTGVGITVGTPAYMAPEQLAADPTLDHRADIYAFGVVAYELLSGARPFATLSGASLVRAQMADTPTALGKPVPAALSNLVARCLAKSPADRPSSARELLDVIDSLGSGAEMATSSAPRRRIAPIALAAAAVLVVAIAAWSMLRKPAAPSEQRTAIAPFRVGGASADVRYLREGVADLLLPQLQAIPDERVVPMSTMLDRWKRAAGDAATDLDEGEALRVAADAGATKLMIGDIVGTRAEITLSARLLRVRDGAELRTARVTGAADSAGVLSSRLLITLLAVGDGGTRERISAIGSIAPAALTAYLEGEQRYRRGRYSEAAPIFARGWNADTTFALAALRVNQSNGWLIGRTVPGDWLRRAWQSRDRLHGVDSMLLLSLVGRDYPLAMNRRDHLQLRQELAQQGHSADLWYLYADWVMHDGRTADLPNPDSISLAGFRVAESLDSTFAPALEHQAGLYAAMGDSASAYRALARQAAFDSTGDFYSFSRLMLAHTFESSRAVQEASEAFGKKNAVLLPFLARGLGASGSNGLTVNLDRSDSLLALAAKRTDAINANLMNEAKRLMAWNRGIPADARRARASSDDIYGLITETLAGVMWDGDSTVASASAATLTRWLATAPAEDVQREGAWFAVGTLALFRADTAGVQDALNELQRLRVAPMDEPRRATFAQVLTAQLAVARHSADAAQQVARADSMSRDAPRLHRQYDRPATNVVVGILWETLGNHANAARVLRRTDQQTGGDMYDARRLWYLAEAARGAGDRALETFALRAFVAMRARAEGPLQDDVRTARARLEKLTPQ